MQLVNRPWAPPWVGATRPHRKHQWSMEHKSTSELRETVLSCKKSSWKSIERYQLLGISLLFHFRFPINLDPLSSPTAPLNPPGTGGQWCYIWCLTGGFMHFSMMFPVSSIWWEITSSLYVVVLLFMLLVAPLRMSLPNFACFEIHWSTVLRTHSKTQPPQQRCLPLRQPALQNGFEQLDIFKSSDPEIFGLLFAQRFLTLQMLAKIPFSGNVFQKTSATKLSMFFLGSVSHPSRHLGLCGRGRSRRCRGRGGRRWRCHRRHCRTFEALRESPVALLATRCLRPKKWLHSKKRNQFRMIKPKKQQFVGKVLQLWF